MIDPIRSLMRALACSIALLLTFVPPVLAQGVPLPKRVALVIGVDRYDNLPVDKQLLKAANDARAMGSAFRSLGYRVVTTENSTRLDFLTRWQEFLNAIQPGDQTAVFFAGHGVEIGGQNYLIPSDVPQVGEAQEEILKGAAIALDFLLQTLRDRSPGVSLVVLDACRNNPFVTNRGRSVGRSRGLADARPPHGMFIMYSAGAGEEALDNFGSTDTSDNSVYTRALIPLLTTQGLDITELARRVRRQVHEQVQQVGHRQTPAYYDELIGQFCPAGCNTSISSISGTATDHTPRAASGMAASTIAVDASPEQPPSERTLNEQPKSGLYEGVWLVKGRSTSCPAKSWRRLWKVVGRELFGPKNARIGRIDDAGRFSFRRPGARNPKIMGTFNGHISGDKGGGTFSFPNCSGTFTLART